jgi:flagellar basal body-associated protein FliL
MNENQTLQANNEQSGKKQWIPTWTGVVLILVLVATFIFFFWKFQDTGNSVKQAIESQKAGNNETAQIATQENPEIGNTAPDAANSGAIPASASQESESTMDINYEVKKLDESVNSVSENDFESSAYSDVQIGL